MIAHTEANHSPNEKVVTFENVSGGISWVFRLEDYHPVPAMQSLAYRLIVHCSNDDIAMLSVTASIHDDDITRKNAGALHAVAFHFDQIDMGGSQIEQLIDVKERRIAMDMAACLVTPQA